MRLRRFLRSVWIFCFLSPIGSMAQTQQPEPERIPGEYVVEMRDGESLSTFSALKSSNIGLVIKRWVPEFNLAVIRLQNKGPMANFIKDLQTHSGIKRIEPNYIYRASRIPNDPHFTQLWGLFNYGQQDSKKQIGLSGVDIGADQAWDIQTGHQDVVVAVIDTGVDYNHPDLKANIWTNEAELNGVKGVDDDGNGFIDDIHGYDFSNKDGDPMDDHGHGTHCSGTIGATGDDGMGIVGVAWNVKIMPLKFLSRSGSGSLDNAILAVKYATQMGAKIMSNSWGGGGSSEILKSAIKEASDKGIVFTAAAGNDSNNNDAQPSYPANYDLPNVISVAALDNRGQLAPFSSYGRQTVHVAAPGVNIFSSIRNGGYDSWSGTSMATPHVTGVVALLLSQEPQLSPEEIRTRLIKTSKPLVPMKGRVASNGIINAYFALTNQMAPPDPNDPTNWELNKDLSISTPHPYNKEMTLEWEVEMAGATDMAFFFEKFDTELKYDAVKFYDRQGNILATMSGDLGSIWSPSLKSDYVKIIFITDRSINKYGFDLAKMAYRKGAPLN